MLRYIYGKVCMTRKGRDMTDGRLCDPARLLFFRNIAAQRTANSASSECNRVNSVYAMLVSPNRQIGVGRGSEPIFDQTYAAAVCSDRRRYDGLFRTDRPGSRSDPGQLVCKYVRRSADFGMDGEAYAGCAA